MNASQFHGRPTHSGGDDDPPTTADVPGDEGGPGTGLDLTGYAVESRDGNDVGTVIVYATDHLVVRTSAFGNTVTIPIRLMGRVDHLTRVIYVNEDWDVLRRGAASS
jgi:hypothetical protein